MKRFYFRVEREKDYYCVQITSHFSLPMPRAVVRRTYYGNWYDVPVRTGSTYGTNVQSSFCD